MEKKNSIEEERKFMGIGGKEMAEVFSTKEGRKFFGIGGEEMGKKIFLCVFCKVRGEKEREN